MNKLPGIIFFIFFLFGRIHVLAQDMIFVHFGVDTIRHVINLKMDEDQLQKIHDLRKSKFKIKASQFAYNSRKYKLDDIKLLGNTSLKYRRKNYVVALDKKMSFRTKSGFYKPKDFYLISLSRDKNHFRNRLSFQLLHAAGIFELFHDYVILKINGRDEGLYMLIQRSEDWALKRLGSPYIVKREINKISKEKSDKEIDDEIIKGYQDQFNQLYLIAEKYRGKALYKKLNKIINMESYYKWLAYNYWVMNGDYADELYLYIDPLTQLLEPVAWDYDEIFTPLSDVKGTDLRPPDNNFMVSTEHQFDRYLYMDDYCYQKYKETLYRFLSAVTPDILWKILIETYSELYPYYLEPDVISQSQYDRYGETNLEQLEEEMSKQYKSLIERRGNILKRLEGQLSKKVTGKSKK